MIMNVTKLIATLAACACLSAAWAAAKDKDAELQDKPADAGAEKSDLGKFEPFKPESALGSGSVSVGGQAIAYQSIAGTLIVHPKGWDDVPHDPKIEKDNAPPEGESKNPNAEASMFYVAYFKTGNPSNRPITFIFNGGPGSASVWLHMGAFGPRRIITPSDQHTPAAPYSLVNNNYSLLDVTDMVFIDAPGTGFSRIAGKDKEKAFFGVDPDAYAFTEFVTQFLTKYGRWNSPKYLFGESYGTTRSAVLINELESERSIDFNGVILLSQILNFDLSADRPTLNPGIDLPYQLVLPTYAASAWYHHKLAPDKNDLEALLTEVENFAMGDYGRALAAGTDLSAADRTTIAAKLHDYTGLSVEYILRADLRIDGGEFRQNLQADQNITTGRLDTRFSGPDIDPLSQRAEYDPQATALSSAYVSAFNDYARKELHYSNDHAFKLSIPIFQSWNALHQQPGQNRAPTSSEQGLNVMQDLANAMKVNTNLKVLLNAGYFDLATPFYEGIYEMHHLPMPANLQQHIQYKFYESGHMVYAKDSSLKLLHDTSAAFIRDTGAAAH
jgi:carboxypeptidase C (cathepsin A)